MESGVVLYLRQEGRGIGFVNKVRAYGLQDHGYDAVEANGELSFRDDERDYSVTAHVIDSLRIKSIRLMTNNPRKVRDLTRHGIKITERIPLIIPPNLHNQFYLDTKAAKSGHLIDTNGKERLQKQSDFPVLEGLDAEQIAAIHN